MNETMSIRRLWLMIVREFSLNKINLLIIAASMILVSMIITFVKGYYFLSPTSFQVSMKVYNTWPIVLVIYCVVVTAFIFSELNSSDKKIDYLMLPSSLSEKYLTKFLFTSIGFILLAALALSINKLQVNYLNNWTIYIPQFQSFENNYWIYVKSYLLMHSIFFFGSIYFRKMELAKTILALISLIITIYFFAQFLKELGLVDLIKIKEYLAIGYSGFNDEQNQIPTVQSIAKLKAVYSEAESLGKWVMQYLLPPFFWILGFLRLKEIEVKDGI